MNHATSPALDLPVIARGLFGAIAILAAASAQCANVWLPGAGVSGTNQEVRATTMWDPDGAGPAQPVLVVGGYFEVAGDVPANRIAAFDPVTGAWSALGTGMTGSGPYTEVHALATLPNGDLVAAGQFTTAGGVSANQIARWNGVAWSPLGAGLTGVGLAVSGPSVRALAVMPNGDLVAAGDFTHAGGALARGIARWDGSTWSPLGPGISSGLVRALCVMPNGDLIAGGGFNLVGGVSAPGVARWNGTAWSSLGTGTATFVFAMTLLPNGNLVASGASVQEWNGTTWNDLGPMPNGVVFALAALPNGDLVGGGDFTDVGGVSANRVARWNGTTWSPLGSGIVNPAPSTAVDAFALLPNGDLVAGGTFALAEGVGANYIARWNGAAWSTLGNNTNGGVAALAAFANGDLVAGGYFTAIDGVSAQRVARWNGTAWSAMGSGMTAPGALQPAQVLAVTTLPNGDVVAGGVFSTAGGAPIANIARWNGSTWSAMGSGILGAPFPQTTAVVRALVTMSNGDIIAAGDFLTAGGVSANNIARWNGSTWSPLGAGTSSTVYSLAVLPNGDVVAGGRFAAINGVTVNNVARWNGATWSTMGQGFGTGVFSGGSIVLALTTLPNGDVVAGGGFTIAQGSNANYIARWNGTAWSPLGTEATGVVYALAQLPNGDLAASGTFALPAGQASLARWNGATWSALGPSLLGQASVLAGQANGDLVAGGFLATTSGPVAAYLARLTTTCPASAVVTGAGCLGSGFDTLTATSLPWIGSTFRSVASGLPANSLALHVLGLSPLSTPLSAILPQGVPGCTLLVSPDAIEALVPAGASVQTQLAIPNALTLVGLLVHQQVVPIEFNALGDITALTSTNELTLTIGSF